MTSLHSLLPLALFPLAASLLFLAHARFAAPMADVEPRK